MTDDRIQAHPVGYVRSELTDRGQAPRQGRVAEQDAAIVILHPYTDALNGIAQWTQLLVVCWMHLAERNTLVVHPRGDGNAPLTGVFATRSPARPNPLVVYTVDLLSFKGNTLYVRGIDAVDGTPVLDIKPHIHRLDD
jgi:tRNA-Thr(GGU) m(6)t(6)A37 methyltransferase TsaA